MNRYTESPKQKAFREKKALLELNALLERIEKNRESRPPPPPPTLSDWVGAILEGTFNLSKALLTFVIGVGGFLLLSLIVYLIVAALTGGDGGGAGPPNPYE